MNRRQNHKVPEQKTNVSVYSLTQYGVSERVWTFNVWKFFLFESFFPPQFFLFETKVGKAAFIFEKVDAGNISEH